MKWYTSNTLHLHSNRIVWQSGVKDNTSAWYMNNKVANIIRSISFLVTGCEQASYAEFNGNAAIARLWISLSSEVSWSLLPKR